MEPVKMTEEEVEKIIELQKSNQTLAVELGLVELSIERLKVKKEKLLSEAEDLVEKDSAIGKELADKYGNGTIDLDKGEFLPVELPK